MRVGIGVTMHSPSIVAEAVHPYRGCEWQRGTWILRSRPITHLPGGCGLARRGGGPDPPLRIVRLLEAA